MIVLKTLLLGLLLAGIIGFSIKNARLVQLRYFWFIDSFDVPLFLLVLLSITLGLFAGAMIDLAKRRRLRKVIHRQEKLAKKLREGIRLCRDLAFTDGRTEGRR
jgi:uncharacterized integral membrane protein